jgi:orotate phosphoribosyltransferase
MTTGNNLSQTEKLAEMLFDIGVFQINMQNPFVWTSGIRSPLYCDNRKINSNVAVRDAVVCAFVDYIAANYKDVEMVAGVATGGIPIGVLVADRLKLPFIYVRSEAKKHGLMKQVEGAFEPGAKVVLIEDHISTGGSSMKAVKGIQNEGLQLLGLISNMTYGFDKAYKLFQEEGIQVHSICNLDLMIQTAKRTGRIKEEDVAKVLKFKENPEQWYDNVFEKGMQTE